MSYHRALYAFLTTAFLLSFVGPASGRSPQDDGQRTQLRTVHGEAVDKQGNAVGSAIVYLENVKTREVRTYIVATDGMYHFSGLDPNVDYEIHAEKDDETSSTRTISSYDNRRDMEMFLKLNHKKPPK